MNSGLEADAAGRETRHSPAVPIGNAPPGRRWPVAVAGFAWLAWIGFLVVMVVTRTCSFPA